MDAVVSWNEPRKSKPPIVRERINPRAPTEETIPHKSQNFYVVTFNNSRETFICHICVPQLSLSLQTNALLVQTLKVSQNGKSRSPGKSYQASLSGSTRN